MFNTDQGSQFTSLEFTQIIKDRGVRISMNGKGLYSDNIFVERLCRAVKYEEVCLKGYAIVLEAQPAGRLPPVLQPAQAHQAKATGPRPRPSMGSRTPQKASLVEGGVHRERESSHWHESRDSHFTRS